jgi:hypothetical protein
LPPLQPLGHCRAGRQRCQIDPEVIILKMHRFSLLILFWQPLPPALPAVPNLQMVW